MLLSVAETQQALASATVMEGPAHQLRTSTTTARHEREGTSRGDLPNKTGQGLPVPEVGMGEHWCPYREGLGRRDVEGIQQCPVSCQPRALWAASQVLVL